MSSSDSRDARNTFPDWAVFGPREVPGEVELLSPAAEAAGLLQLYHGDLAAARQQQEDVRMAGLRALAQQAVFAFQFGAALERYQPELTQGTLLRAHRHLRVLKDQMLDALRAAGLEIEVPLGQSFEQVADAVHVDGWRHESRFTSEVVAEVSEPIVKAGGALIRLGRVVMGAPVEQAGSATTENGSPQ